MTGVVSTQPLLYFCVNVGSALTVGHLGGGLRRFIPITGGTVSGAHEGVILPGGGDWQTVLADGSLELEARYHISIGDAVVEVQSNGLRTGSPEVLARLSAGEIVPTQEYYFRTAVRLRSGDEKLAYLNKLLFVSTGERRASQVHLSIIPIL